MKKLFLPFLFFNCALCILNSAFSQNPSVKMWDNRFGGTGSDWLYFVQQTYDGGYILGGFSDSNISGDKTQPLRGGSGDIDYWVVKTDSLGNKLWDKDFGGTGLDWLSSVEQTSDEGYILGGTSYSNISGDKTQNIRGGFDYWIVKTDSLGNKLWDKDFGGTYDDRLTSIHQTEDGGYILAGYSSSISSGDKTQSTWGDEDYWIIKTDSLGNKLWDRDFGGTNVEALNSIAQTSDEGYILGGTSLSGISGDKTQNTRGQNDYWIIKTDSLGNKLWDRDFGGADIDACYSIGQSRDGGYILGGKSLSGISGDKTQNTKGLHDYWVVKTDSLGNKLWDKDFGGTGEEEWYNLDQTLDGGFINVGTSWSSISGDKTEANLGVEQVWIVKIDSLGNMQWDKTIFTPGYDSHGFAVQTRDGCYAVGNSSDGGVGGYKTQNAWGSYDFWIVKLCETILVNFTTVPNLCPGTCTNFTNLSFNATSYQWNFFGASPDTSTDINPTNICYANPGSYDVQLIAANANGSDTLLLSNFITVYPQPSPQSILQSDDTLFANLGFNSYQWYHNGSLIPGATNYFLVLADSGNYNVISTNINGCDVEAAIFDVHIGIEEFAYEKILTSPNPVIDECTIQNPEFMRGKYFEISVYNVLGDKMYPLVKSGPLTVDCRMLPSGIYFLAVLSDKKIFRSKFVKQ